MDDKKIEIVKNWPEPTLVRDIQIFIGFVNFYGRFIGGFSKIATSLTAILKIIRSFEESASKANNNEVVSADGRADKTIVNLSSGNSTYISNIKAIWKPNFLIPNIKKAFNYLK